MSPSLIKLVFIGVLTYLVGLLVYLPASWILPRLLPEEVALQGIEGRLWSGSASRLKVGDLQLQQLGWDWHLLPLLGGQLELMLGTQGPGLDVKGVASWGLWSERLELQDVSAEVSSDYLSQWLDPSFQLTGKLDVRLKQLQWQQNQLIAINGKASWADAGFGVNQAIGLGQLEAVFEPKFEGTQAKLQGDGGDLDLNGNVMLKADGDYQVVLRLLPQVKLNKSASSQLSLLGISPNGGGEWKYAGQWFKPSE